MDADEDGLIWITEPALRRGSIQDTEWGCVWLRHCLGKGSDLHWDSGAPELGGESLSQLHGKKAPSTTIFLQVTLGLSDYVYVTYQYFLFIRGLSRAM